MKKLAIIFFALCPLIIVQAQSALFVKEKVGTNTAFNLSKIKSLTFVGVNVTVNKKDASTSSFIRTDVQYINFGVNYSTNIAPIKVESDRSLTLYPNPSHDVLNIELSNPNSQAAQIEIIGIDGKVALRCVLNQAIGSISIVALPKGLYLLRCNNGTNTTSTKFIKL